MTSYEYRVRIVTPENEHYSAEELERCASSHNAGGAYLSDTYNVLVFDDLHKANEAVAGAERADASLIEVLEDRVAHPMPGQGAAHLDYATKALETYRATRYVIERREVSEWGAGDND